MGHPLLEIRDLTTVLRTDAGVATAVDRVSLSLEAARTLALVGESGSGKSLACLSMLGLLPPNGRVMAGEVWLAGTDLLRCTPVQLARMRGRQVGMVLQDAMTSLNPLMTIGAQVAEVFRYHEGIRARRELRRRSIEALERVGIPAPAERLSSYPFQFSGGMRQRVSIAINIACRPQLLICDEPTTALDASVQRQILALLREVQTSEGMAILFVTHDLRLTADFCDDVAVMYDGRIVEAGPIGDVFARPAHPYTEGLLAATPTLFAKGPLVALPGQPPTLAQRPPGCRFAPRCVHARARCRADYPDWFEWEDGANRARRTACWKLDPLPGPQEVIQ